MTAHHDSELLDIFLEEGFDIIESSGAALVRWQAEPSNRQEVETLLRDLHTLKGGARMVEIGPIGDLAHELEFLYEVYPPECCNRRRCSSCCNAAMTVWRKCSTRPAPANPCRRPIG
jgi:chemotaxis protein histidine kinase CheA